MSNKKLLKENLMSKNITKPKKSNKMSSEFICDVCHASFTRKFNLDRHKNTSRCRREQLRNNDETLLPKVNIIDESEKNKPTPENPYGKFTPSNDYNTGGVNMFIHQSRRNPTHTHFKKILNVGQSGRQRFTTFLTKNIAEGPCQSFFINEEYGDVIGNLYINVNVNSLNENVTLTFDNTQIFEMTARDLFHLSRSFQPANQNQNDTIDINVLEVFAGSQYFPLCGGHIIRLNGVFEGYSAEIICLNEEEKKRFSLVGHEFVVYGFHIMDVNEEANIITRYPVMDILAVSEDNNRIEFNINNHFEQQLLSDQCGLFKSRLSPNLTQDKVYYFTTQLHEQKITEFENWTGYLIPSTLNFSVEQPCHLILRYMTFFRLEKQSSAYDSGLTEESRPIKEILTKQIEKAYKEHQSMPEVESHLLTKVIDDKVPGHRVYYENHYFMNIPTGQSHPIKLPTNLKVSVEISEMIRRVINHPLTKSEVIYGAVKCRLLNKSWSKSYEFKVDDTYYNFTELLIDEYTILNIQPSQPFVDAMRKFLTTNPEKDSGIPNVREEHQVNTVVEEKKTPHLKDIVLGKWVNCYDEKYAIKNFYVKEINGEILKSGYYLVFGSRYGYQVIGHTKTITYVPEMEMYRLEFYDEIINAIDIDIRFKNCLLFNVLKYSHPTVRCDLQEGSPQPKQKIYIEYELTDGFKISNDIIRTYVKWHDTKSENIIEIQPNGNCGCRYDVHTKNRIIFTANLSQIPKEFTYMIHYVDNDRLLLVKSHKMAQPRKIELLVETTKQKSINHMAREMCFHGDLIAFQNCMSQTPPPTNLVRCFLDACYTRAVDIVRYLLEKFQNQLSKDDIDAGYVLARYANYQFPGNLCLNELLESYGAVNRDNDNTGLTTSVLLGHYDKNLVW